MSTEEQKINEIKLTEKQLLKYKKAFGNNLKEVRLKKGLSQTALASMLGYEKTTISRIENGRTNFTFSTIVKICLALNVEIKEVYNFEFLK
ncbi:helix-turn-helix domain-containing protein [Psychroserpens sp. XS_ASV72]|uniref:helix-turn-helix domain-containing protein n=1 Tax=Psychroserpens sp. XS_ASV72 TaxID=3241293 RepID=UPI0035154FB6